MTDPLPHYKIVMLGRSGVGKTAMVERVADDIFVDSHVPTVGAQFVANERNIDGNTVMLELWDTAGQEVFKSLVGFYAREARGAFILFDVTDVASFEDVPKWLEFVRENSPQARVILFGNKTDLHDSRKVSSDDIRAFASQQNLGHFEGSAKSGEKVADAFDRMAELVFSLDGAKDGGPATVKAKDGKKGGCC